MAFIFDIETNGFLEELTKIHCIMIHNTETHKLERYDPAFSPVKDAVKRIEKADTIIGHNIIGFDVPAIKKIFPDFEFKGEIIDTYVWAACVWPNIADGDYKRFREGRLPASLIGKHSLEAYGYRLGVYKGAFAKQTDWSTWSNEMSAYCEQDVAVTFKLLDKLRGTKTSWDQVLMEQDVMGILNRQQKHGVLFNLGEAQELYRELSNKREKLREEIQKSFPPFWKRKGKLFTPKRRNKTKGYVAGATMQHVELCEFNPSSNIHISRMLMLKYGWIPEEFADKEMVPVEMQYIYNKLKIISATVPKIEEEILKRLPYKECKPLAEFQMLQKRCAMIAEGKQAWLRCYNEETGRIHGAINQFGTVTGRCNHFKPNLGQVTAPRSPYGKEMRSLFTVPHGWFLVGCDADGLEARCKAHYITPFDKGEFVQCILEGKRSEATDIHSLNRDRLGFASRDHAKTWYYAFMYGSGNANLGSIAMEDDNYKDYTGDKAALGKKHRAKLGKEFKGLKELMDAIQTTAKKRSPKMWLKGLDGRRIPVRAIYSSLNALLQSAGAVIMKKALVIADELIRSKGLTPIDDYVQILFVHDELQFECRTKEIAETVAKCAEECIRLAGEHFKLRCPLSGSSKIGKTWLDTH